jgi:hypothetical protein
VCIDPIFGRGIVTPLILIVFNEWHDILKESGDEDSLNKNCLCVLCVSSAAGGEINKDLTKPL